MKSLKLIFLSLIAYIILTPNLFSQAVIWSNILDETTVGRQILINSDDTYTQIVESHSGLEFIKYSSTGDILSENLVTEVDGYYFIIEMSYDSLLIVSYNGEFHISSRDAEVITFEGQFLPDSLSFGDLDDLKWVHIEEQGAESITLIYNYCINGANMSSRTEIEFSPFIIKSEQEVTDKDPICQYRLVKNKNTNEEVRIFTDDSFLNWYYKTYDSFGNLLIEQMIDSISHFQDVHLTDEGEVVILGVVNTLRKYDVDGRIVFNKQYESGLQNEFLSIQKILENDDELTLAGTLYRELSYRQDFYISSVSLETGLPTWKLIDTTTIDFWTSIRDFTVLPNGEYLVSGTTNISDVGGIGNSFFMKVKQGQSSIKSLDEQSVSLVPNPTDGIINVQEVETEIKDIGIYTSDGQLLHYQENLDPMDLSNYPTGIYFFKIATEQGILTEKVIKN